jgi:hypothetical protein
VTDRPSLTCPRCGSSDVHIVSVHPDGGTQVRCADRNCSPDSWRVPAPASADVTVLALLGQELADYRAASEVPLVGDLDGRRAKAGAARAELAIRNLLEEVAA